MDKYHRIHRRYLLSDWFLWIINFVVIWWLIQMVILGLWYFNCRMKQDATSPGYWATFTIQAVAAAISVINATSYLRRRRKIRERKWDQYVIRQLGCGVCPECGYSLIGLPDPRCPECGTPFDPTKLYLKSDA